MAQQQQGQRWQEQDEPPTPSPPPEPPQLAAELSEHHSFLLQMQLPSGHDGESQGAFERQGCVSPIQKSVDRVEVTREPLVRADVRQEYLDVGLVDSALLMGGNMLEPIVPILPPPAAPV
jgi:hypothetical protein